MRVPYLFTFFLWNIQGPGEMTCQLRALAALVRDPNLTPSPPTICKPSSMEPNGTQCPSVSSTGYFGTIQSKIKKKTLKNGLWSFRLVPLKRIKVLDGLMDAHWLVSEWHEPGLTEGGGSVVTTVFLLVLEIKPWALCTGRKSLSCPTSPMIWAFSSEDGNRWAQLI